jgi:endonuclease/exonuclease/phosphatase family metal-dependent hydrolase
MSESVRERHDGLCVHKDAQSSDQPPMPSHWFFRGGGRLRRLLAVPFVLGCLAVLALTVLYRWPRVNPWTCYIIIWPPLLWMGPALATMLLGIPAVRTRWLLCGVLVWCVGLTMSDDVVQWLKLFPGRSRERFEALRWGVRSSMARDANSAGPVNVPLRVVTWNIHFGRAGPGDEYARQIAELDPDIVFLQYYSSRTVEDGIKRSPVLRSYYFTRHEGDVILSRFPMVSLPNAARVPNQCCACRIEIRPGLQITCVNAHFYRLLLQERLQVRGWSQSRVAKMIQGMQTDVDELAELLDSIDGPIILGGDFNLQPNYPALSRIRRDFKDCFKANGYGWGKTVPSKLPALRLDMIFVPPNAEVFYAGAVSTRLSLHRMTLAEVAIPVLPQPRLAK